MSFSTYKLFLLILTGSTLSFADVDPSLSVIGSFDPGSPVSWNYRNAPEFTGTPSGGSSTPDNLGTFSLPTLPQGADPFHGDSSALLLDVWLPPSNVRNGTSPPTDPHETGNTQPGGTQSGDLPYLTATGKSFSLRAASIFTLVEGKIQRESRYYNMLSFLAQLGAVSGDTLPPLGTPQPAPPR